MNSSMFVVIAFVALISGMRCIALDRGRQLQQDAEDNSSRNVPEDVQVVMPVGLAQYFPFDYEEWFANSYKGEGPFVLPEDQDLGSAAASMSHSSFDGVVASAEAVEGLALSSAVTEDMDPLDVEVSGTAQAMESQGEIPDDVQTISSLDDMTEVSNDKEDLPTVANTP
eukprot:TRINITY_DN16911_c0_g1_i3.p2 TRINITY_DN16911_c0_g1~~TRINITY_DN16911_c0_g1_i3.p2  ORF type:complete len:169 (-),score=30.20 TRINITY_DN16911_c0_g1_i3:356-862(-)